jgi:serine/threonine-protein kinase
LDGTGTLFGAVAALGASIGMSAFLGKMLFTSALVGITTGFGTLVLGMAGSSFAYLVYAARRLSLLGFAHPDLGPAFKTEIEQAREEHAVEHSRGASTMEKWLLLSAKVAGATFGVSLAAMFAMLWSRTWLIGSFNAINAVSFVVGIAGSATVLLTVAYLALLQRRKDVDTEFWAKLWMGRIGKLAFSVAKRMLGNRVLGSAMTHRATELSLGMAAENLYESLPKETRHELSDLPDLIRRLQGDAQGLRKRHDELQEALADAGDAGSSDAYTDLRAGRDAIHAKLGEAVGALETIRLNLLRLHAGSGTVEGLTTHIDLAAEVSAEVERMLAAQEEVERGLSFPRETAATPV